MSTDHAILVVAVRRAHTAQLLPTQLRERLVAYEAETMTLLEACVDLRGVAELARFEKDETKARDAEARATEFATLGLQVMRAGGWHAVIGGASADAIADWAATIASIGSGLSEDRLARYRNTAAPKAEATFDLKAKVATLRIDLSALVDDWRIGVIDDPARPDHGWPTVCGRIYGDPRCEDGQEITLYGLPAPDGCSMRGLHMTYDLGRRSEDHS